MSNEKFCLRWNDFESNISLAFREIREDKEFFDITLACEEEKIEAHKVILSACSPFFKSLIRQFPHQHPLVFLKGVKYADLIALLDFMYHGEVNVAQDELNSFLSVAEELKVKGLTQNDSQKRSGHNSSHNRHKEFMTANNLPDKQTKGQPIKKYKLAPPRPPHERVDDDVQEIVPIKSEPRETNVMSQESTLTKTQDQKDQYEETPRSHSQSIALAEGTEYSYNSDVVGQEDYGPYEEEYAYSNEMMSGEPLNNITGR